MTAEEFRNIYRELIDENPLAIRAVLKVLDIEFTDTVPTLAVTCEARPRLLVNLAFVGEHCRTDAEVKAVICHEFLHVLLRHTERFTVLTPPEHLALDAVINAIIHRTLGPDYSGMMSRYYADERGIARLLRPPPSRNRSAFKTPAGVVAGRGPAGAGGLGRPVRRPAGRGRHSRSGARSPEAREDAPAADLLGNHDAVGRRQFARRRRARAVLTEAIEGALKAMNGSGIFRSPRPGVGADAYATRSARRTPALDRWRRETYAVLRRHLLPDPRSVARESADRSFTLPVLSPGDRRAALRALWSPFLPDARWDTTLTARSRIGPGVSRRQRLDGRGNAAHRRAARPAVASHSPALLGVQQRRRAGAHRTGPARQRHDRRHQHELRARARGAHAAQRGGGRHGRLHRTARSRAGGGRGRHAPARHRHARRQSRAAAARRSAVHATLKGAVMIRMSEVVLPGHPDKFCDQVADAIVAECYAADPRAYCQVEMSTWCDQVFLTGGIVTRQPLARDWRTSCAPSAATSATWRATPSTRIATRCATPCASAARTRARGRTTSTISASSIGWAGYDARVAWLPPEHYLAHRLGEALAAQLPGGPADSARS